MVTYILAQAFLIVLICANVHKEIYKIVNTTQLECKYIQSGYKCIGKNFNREQTVCKSHENICPKDLACIDLPNRFFCSNKKERTKRYDFINDCSETLCQNGALCKNGSCECLKHFRGKYCHEKVDYCKANPCKRNISCVSRVGGFTCNCSERLAGRYCEKKVDVIVRNMKNPDFLYVSLQYTGIKYFYIFHADDMGLQAEVEVDFGDGTIEKQKYPVIDRNRSFINSFNYFNLPLDVKREKLEIYKFEHVYKEPKIYSVRVRAWNRFEEVYNTDYEIRATGVDGCSLGATLRNVPLNKRDAFRIYREDPIYILSGAWSDCIESKFSYQWNIHKVITSFDDKLTSSNLYHIEIDLKKPYLHIPPYNLKYGQYTVTLNIKIVKSIITGASYKLSTWFTVLQKPIVAHIQGGNVVYKNMNSLFYLDATLSYDPNYSRQKQPKMRFIWTCQPATSNFCKGNRSLNETGPVLVVPPNSLDPRMYHFTLWINHGTNTTITKYTGTATQKVYVSASSLAFYSINCIKNCIGGRWNALFPIVLRGVCISVPEYEESNKKSWSGYSNPEQNNSKGMRLNNTDYSEDNYVILYEQHQKTFKLVFSGYNVDYDTLGEDTISYAEFYLTSHSKPKAPNCIVRPPGGFGLLTSFTIRCTSIVKETTRFEVVQFYNLSDRSLRGIMVGYDSTGTIRDVVLSPGLRENNYVTTLLISQILHSGMYVLLEKNVTVFPLINFFKNESDEVMHYLLYRGIGLRSPLYAFLSGNDYFKLVGNIISIGFSLEDFLRANTKYTECITTIEQLRDNLIHYLCEIPIGGDVQFLKHFMSALHKVIDLPFKEKRWQSSINLGLSILKNVIGCLEERFNVHDELILQNDMDDISIIILNIASSILNDKREANVKTVEESSSISYNQLNDIIGIIERCMQLYLTYKVPNERTTLTTSSNSKLGMFIKKASPDSLTLESLSLASGIGIKLRFGATMYHKNAYLDLKAIFIHTPLSSWNSNLDDITGFRFPLVKVNLTNTVDQSPIKASLEVDIQPINTSNMEIIHGYLPVRSSWQIEDMQVHRLILPKGGKLLIKFLPIEGNHKLKIVIKRETRPTLADLWRNGIDIPQNVTRQARDGGLSVLVDDENSIENSYYFLGVLLHNDSLKKLRKDVEERILPNALPYDDSLEGTDESINLKNLPQAQFIKYQNDPSDIDYNNRTLPYAFTVHSVNCIKWNNQNSHCRVKETTTFSRVSCQCRNNYYVTAVFQNVPVLYQRYTTFFYFLRYNDNPLIPYVVVYTLIIFIGLFVWATVEDHKDRKNRTVCFLVDNYPDAEYSYLLIVHTGRSFKAATTSNVTIELEGTSATCIPHVLKDWRRETFFRGSQEFFVVKTMKPLGDIYCLHIWTDFSGPRPSWYCSKIIVQDLQEQQVWFFIVQKWFEPISGDGTMSYTIYRSLDEEIFSVGYQLKENLAREFDSGMHGWISIFHKHPYSNYTRKQRVAVANVHMLIMMLILMMHNELPGIDVPYYQIYSKGSFQWESRDIRIAIQTVFLAIPFHCLLIWLFRCIKPSAQWSEARLDANLSRFNMDAKKSVVWITVDVAKPVPQSSIQVTRRTPAIKKTVSFYSDFYEPEGDRRLRSKLSMDRLVEKAGVDKVVPLRTPTSKIETDTGRYDVSHSTNVPVSQVYGQEIITQSFCFPPSCLYIAWIVLVLILILCVYAVVFYGIAYGWVSSVHYLISFFLAIVFSIVLVEPFKLFVMSVFMFFSNREFTIEDRSDLVAALNHEFTIASSMRPRITEKINKLRKEPTYIPLTVEQVSKFKRNRVVTFMTRFIIADFMLMTLIVLLVLTIMYNVYSTFSYLHYENVKTIFQDTNLTRTNTITDVYTQNDLVYYLEHTIVANLHFWDESNSSSNNMELKPVRDGVNYLIGVVRLRQVRKSKNACYIPSKGIPRWSSRCTNNYDQANYTENWNPKLSRFDIKNEAWTYRRYREIGESFSRFNETRYPFGCYMALLGRTKEDSLKKLKYLKDHCWFDYLTKAIFIDFVLYNPHNYYLTLTTLMAERSDQGIYYIYNVIEVIHMHPTEMNSQLYLIIYLLAICILLMIYVHNESKKYSLLRPKQFFSKKWNLWKKFLLVLGVISIAIYTRKTMFLNYYHKQISMAAQDEYIDFGDIATWDKVLIKMVAFMLLLVILDLCNIFRTFYRVNLAWTAISQSWEAVFSFTVFIIFLILAFACSGYILYSGRSYDFQSFPTTFFTILGFLQRNFHIRKFGNISDMWHTTFVFYLTLFVLVLCIFRWLITVIIMHLYSSVKNKTRFELYQSIFSNKRTRRIPCDTFECSPNRKNLKLAIYLQKVEWRQRALGYLFVHFYKQINGQKGNHRMLAMDVVVESILKGRYVGRQYHEHLHKYQREEQAKALTRTIIITNALKNKLEYLGAKIDIFIRNERYRHLGLIQ